MVATLFLGLSLLSQEPAFKPNWVFDTVIGVGTGSNGYEEYCRAADFVRQPAIRELYERSQDREKQDLATRSALNDACGPAFELIRRGNNKPAEDRREKSNTTLFPQFAEFKTIAKIYQHRIYVLLAKGKPDAAAQALLECLTFSESIAQGSIIADLVYTAMNSIAVAELEGRFGGFGVGECDRLISFVTASLARPNPLVNCLNGEVQSIAAYIKDIKAGREDLMSWFDDEGNTRLKNLTPSQLIAALDDSQRIVISAIRCAQKAATEPEATWDDFQNLEEPEQLTPAQLIASVLSASYKEVLRSSLKSRTQLRLLRLHAAIAKFRWEHMQLPSSLAALPKLVTLDPISNETFVYERHPFGYELYSVGFRSFGPIHLKYRQPKPPPDDNLPPYTYAQRSIGR